MHNLVYMNNRKWPALERHVIYTCKPTCTACALLMYINKVVLDWIMEYRPLINAAQMATPFITDYCMDGIAGSWK